MVAATLLFITGIGVNLLASLIIIRGIYYPVRRDQEYIFTFLAFPTVIYLVMGLFTSVELSIGVGFGLFALFSVLRYRTDTVPIREMTYLFVMVALPVLNSILFTGGEYTRLAISDLLIIMVLWFLEQKRGFVFDQKRMAHYERIDLVRADRRDELIADLRARTGLAITRAEVIGYDFLRDAADLMITYPEGSASLPPAGEGSLSLPILPVASPLPDHVS